MMQTTFTLLVVATQDGYIAREPGHTPTDWASPEEQDLFFAAVDAADWSVMGRGTHEVADRPNRRRIVFSGQVTAPEWRRATQLWLDPNGLKPQDFAPLVDAVHPLRHGLILGGTPVHDWFLRRGAIDAIELTVEPLMFGGGLPIFTDHADMPPEQALAAAGFVPVDERVLNAQGTRLISYRTTG